ncbi:MAG: proline--tRNA ligase [Actinobacteria bacterium]|nr:proline--tRNA ligase [Actinomycetota bacterium]
MRASRLFMPTLKEDPSDAEAASHKLLVRGGFVRQFASGIYIFLPLGWRVIERVNRIIREEMDAIGALELSMPTIHTADVWQQTGRYYDIGGEMFRLKDRSGRDMVLAMTHEEVFTWLASRELRSYRELPQIWYQIQLKFRDETRPKGGVLRVREFLMKDSYSFDADAEGLEVSYAKHIQAYDRIFERTGLRFHRVDSDPGMMGGAQAHEYMAPSPAGEDRVAVCSSCGYAGNIELARSVARAPEGSVSEVLEEVPTPGQRTIRQVSEFLELPASSLIKSLLVVTGEERVLALVRGDQELHQRKLERHLQREVRPAHPEEVEEATGAEIGFIGPLGVDVRIVADESLAPTGPGGARAYVTGANKAHTHLLGVMLGRDVDPEYADLREAQEGDSCVECGSALTVEPTIEVGNIFKLGTKYSVALGATVLDEDGVEIPLVMGSYGIGPARIAAAAVEQSHDEKGIVWPKSIAPFDVHLVQVHATDEEQTRVAAHLYEALGEEGWQVLWDDRDERPGVKFKDAELIGCPVRVTVGRRAAEGVVEVEPRGGDQSRREVSVDELPEVVSELWRLAD